LHGSLLDYQEEQVRLAANWSVVQHMLRRVAPERADAILLCAIYEICGLLSYVIFAKENASIDL
jgi:hypothetical protein